MKKENNKDICGKIISLIEGEYDSDAAFERAAGLAPKTVNNWRRGRSSSYMKMLPELAELFDVSVSEILDMPITGGHDLSDDEAELLSLYRKSGLLSPKQRLALFKTLESVIELYISSAPNKKRGKDLPSN